MRRNYVERKEFIFNMDAFFLNSTRSVTWVLKKEFAHTNESSINLLGEASFPKEGSGPVDQSGMIAAFARRKPRVQIPPGPL